MNKAIVRHAYETSIDRVARLTAYALAHDLAKADEEVIERGRRLAIDDLVLAAISLRRLTEGTGLVAYCQNLTIPLAVANAEKMSRTGSVPMWRTIGVIVHAQTLDIVEDDIDVLTISGRLTVDAIAQRTGLPRSRTEPVCDARSDRLHLAFFVNDFAWRCGELLAAARSAGSANGLHLDHMLNEP